MGQYYMPTLIHDDGTINTLYSHEYNNGLKLMEHSYVGNNFVNAVLTQIWHNPLRIAWIGDYSSDKQGDAYESILPEEEFMRIFRIAWGESDRRIQPKSRGLLTVKNCRRYLVNHTKKVYIDMKEYVEKNKWHEEGEWRKWYRNGRSRLIKYSFDKCVNPPPLLTACGNDRGGGDYHDCFPDFDKVGTWAFDSIEITGINPTKTGYQPVMFHFTEQERS